MSDRPRHLAITGRVRNVDNYRVRLACMGLAPAWGGLRWATDRRRTTCKNCLRTRAHKAPPLELETP